MSSLGVNKYLLPTKKFAKATITSNYTIPTSTSNLPLDTINSNTGELTLVSNGIRIGAGIKLIRILPNLFFENMTSDRVVYMWLRPNKNASALESYLKEGGGVFASVSYLINDIPVKEGDIIYIKIDPGYESGKSGCIVRGGFSNTMIGIEVIE